MTDIRSGGRPRESAGAAPAQAERIQSRALPSRPLPPRPLPAGPAHDAPKATVRKPRPDPGPLRIALALTGIATASALVTAILGPATHVDAGGGNSGGVGAAAGTATETPAASVQHVTRIIQLAPGQTAPPQAVVQQQPAPKPRVNVVVTKQSGK